MLIIITKHNKEAIRGIAGNLGYKRRYNRIKERAPIGLITTIIFPKLKLIRDIEGFLCTTKYFYYRSVTQREKFLYYILGPHVLEKE